MGKKSFRLIIHFLICVHMLRVPVHLYHTNSQRTLRLEVLYTQESKCEERLLVELGIYLVHDYYYFQQYVPSTSVEEKQRYSYIYTATALLFPFFFHHPYFSGTIKIVETTMHGHMDAWMGGKHCTAVLCTLLYDN